MNFPIVGEGHPPNIYIWIIFPIFYIWSHPDLYLCACIVYIILYSSPKKDRKVKSHWNSDTYHFPASLGYPVCYFNFLPCFVFFDRMESLKPQAVWLQSSSLCTPSLRLPASAPQVCWDGDSMGWKDGKNGGFVGISWEYNGNIMGMAMQWKIYCTGIKSLLGGMWPLVVKSRESRTMEGASLETRLVRPPWKAEGETWITHTNFTGPFVGGFYDC